MQCEPPKHVRYLGYFQRLPDTLPLLPNHLTDDLWASDAPEPLYAER